MQLCSYLVLVMFFLSAALYVVIFNVRQYIYPGLRYTSENPHYPSEHTKLTWLIGPCVHYYVWLVYLLSAIPPPHPLSFWRMHCKNSSQNGMEKETTRRLNVYKPGNGAAAPIISNSFNQHLKLVRGLVQQNVTSVGSDIKLCGWWIRRRSNLIFLRYFH